MTVPGVLPWIPLLVAASMGVARPAAAPRATEEPSSAWLGPAAPAIPAAAAADIITIDWRVLRTLDYRTGTSSDTLRALERRLVRLAGFVVPLEDFQESAKEFLLVPYFGACIHLPPPPPNQLVYVTLPNTTRISQWNPVWIEGTLEVIKYKSIYGVAGFRMKADRIVPYENTGKWP
jgi:hypothetical protein